MDKEEIIKRLNTNFIVLSKIENLKDAYKMAGYVFKLLQKLEILNKQLSEKLLVITASISSCADLSDIHDYATGALSLLIPKIQEKTHLKYGFSIESKEYTLSKQKYNNINKLIEATEKDLETAKEYIPNLHLPIKRGKYAKCLHARINYNIRIMYIIDPIQKKLIYIKIISKNDFDNSLRIKPINWINKYKKL